MIKSNIINNKYKNYIVSIRHLGNQVISRNKNEGFYIEEIDKCSSNTYYDLDDLLNKLIRGINPDYNIKFTIEESHRWLKVYETINTMLPNIFNQHTTTEIISDDDIWVIDDYIKHQQQSLFSGWEITITNNNI